MPTGLAEQVFCNTASRFGISFRHLRREFGNIAGVQPSCLHAVFRESLVCIFDEEFSSGHWSNDADANPQSRRLFL